MRIVCPSCAAAYDVPSAALAPGRAVRCARCGTEWAPLAAEVPALPSGPERPLEIPAIPVPGAAAGDAIEPREPLGAAELEQPAEDAAARPRWDNIAPVAAWIASLVLLIALAGAAYAWRAPIMAAWPPSERLYAALGLTPVHGGH